MDKKDEILKEAFSAFESGATPPSEAQKEKMLNNIIAEGRETKLARLKRVIVTYPWRTAFAASAVQAAALSLIFGTRYTNLLLGFFGG